MNSGEKSYNMTTAFYIYKPAGPKTSWNYAEYSGE